jgi:phosphatidyl-myo-inositol dimannoside synthase
MRIFVLATDAFGGYGGIALYNRDVLGALCSDSRVTEVVAVARWRTQSMEALPEKLDYRLGGVQSWVAYTLEVFRCGMRGNFDAIICCHIHLVPLAWLLGRLIKVPIILQIYGLEAWQPTRRLLTDYLVRKVDGIVSISKYTLERFSHWSGVSENRCALLPNAVHLDEYDSTVSGERFRRRLGLSGRKVLLTFGRLVSKERAKGFDEVLEVLPDLLEEDQDIRYVIAGDGPDQARLQLKVEDLGLSACVHFVGMVDEREKNELYCAADLFVMPSRGEGFGFVFLEALACGLPSIGSTVDGSREALIDGEIGTLVDPGDHEALKAAIRHGLTLSKGVPQGLSYFSYPNFVERLWVILLAVLRRGDR